jgi:hypothetical protein
MIVEKKLFFAWNMDKEKKYLEEKAKQGYKLVNVKLGKYYFEEAEPNDVIYQFDFRMLGKQDESEYLEMHGDWELVLRFGGWYYFRKEGTNEESLFSNNEGTKSLLLRLIGFLCLVGFPLYYQILIMFPTMARQDGGLSTFYQIFQPIVFILALLHLYAIIKLGLVYKTLNNDIRE